MPPLEDLIIGGQPGRSARAARIAVIIGGLFLLYRGLIDFRVPLLIVLTAYVSLLILPIPAYLTETAGEFRWLAWRRAAARSGLGAGLDAGALRADGIAAIVHTHFPRDCSLGQADGAACARDLCRHDGCACRCFSAVHRRIDRTISSAPRYQPAHADARQSFPAQDACLMNAVGFSCPAHLPA
jgi:hypothetical protein